MSFSVVTDYQTTLSAPMTSSQLTVPVNSIQTNDATPHILTTSDMGGNGWYLTISPGTANEEIILVTAITAGTSPAGTYTVSAVGRGLAYYGGTDAQGTGNAKAHNAGEIVILSNVKNVYDRLVDKETNETIGGVKTFTLSPLVPTPTVLETTAAASVEYVNNTAISGGVPATTSTLGLTKISVAAVSPGSPISVGDNDPRVPTQSENDALVGDNTDIAVGSGNKYVTQTGLQKSAEMYAVDAQVSDTYVVTLAPVPISYAAGMTVRFKAATTNTGAATLNVNGLGAIAITKNGAIVLEDNDIKAGQTITVVYDSVGPKFQIQSLDKMSQTNATTLTASTTSNADALHTHSQYAEIVASLNSTTKQLFRGGFNDGLTATVVSGGVVTRSPSNSQLDCPTTSDSAILSAGVSLYGNSTQIIDWDLLYSWRMVGSFKIINVVNVETAAFGVEASAVVPSGGTSTARHAAFLFTGSTIYASVADGTTQTRTDVSSGITLTAYNVYEIIFTSTSVVFKINGTTVATLTTNIPVTAATTMIMNIGTATPATAGSQSTILIKHPFAFELDSNA